MDMHAPGYAHPSGTSWCATLLSTVPHCCPQAPQGLWEGGSSRLKAVSPRECARQGCGSARKVRQVCKSATEAGLPRGDVGLDPPGLCKETQAVLLSPPNLGMFLVSTITNHTQEHQAKGSFHIECPSGPVHFLSPVASAGKSFLNYETLISFFSSFF